MDEPPKIIALGIGNILLSDEGVGPKVAWRLKAEYRFPPNVEIYDGGTTGLGLLPYISEADYLVIVDAINGPGEPGSVYRYTVDDFELNIPKKMSIHDVGLIECLALAELDGRIPRQTIILGVKPASLKPGMELTDAVASKVDMLVEMVVKEIGEMGFGGMKILSGMHEC
jgi:hydrogenase maturation protease